MEYQAEAGLIERLLRVVWYRGIVRFLAFMAAYTAFVVLGLSLVLAIPVGYVRLLLTVRRDDEVWHQMFQDIFRMYLWAAGVHLDIKGAEHLPPDYRAVVVAANHQSLLDGAIMDLATGARRGLAVTAPASYFPWPMSFWVAKVGSIQVARSDEEYTKYHKTGALKGKEAIKTAVHEMHERHLSLLIFPEGHVEAGHQPMPFQTGAVRIALQTGVPLIPATVRNANRIMPYHKLMLRPGTIHITFHEPMPLPDDPAYLDDHSLVKLWTNQLLCRIASELPPSYYSPGMVLACKEVLGLHPVLRAATGSGQRLANSEPRTVQGNSKDKQRKAQKKTTSKRKSRAS